MSISVSTRHIRRLYSTAAAAVSDSPAASSPTAAVTATSTTTTTKSISLSKAKSKLRSEHNPQKALDIYSSVSNDQKSPVSFRYAVELTIKRLSKSHCKDEILKLIDSLRNDPKITQETFLSTVIRSYGRAGLLSHAMKLYEEMDDLGTPRSVLSFNALLMACNNSKQFDEVPKLFDSIPRRFKFSPDKFSYGILVKSYCGAGFPVKAVKVIRDMEENGVEITAVTFTTVLDALYRKGKIREAEDIWDMMMMKGCEIDVAVYNVKLMHEHGGKPESVLALIEEMTNAGLKPDTISYNYLMTSYFKNGMIDEAKKVYDDLEANGCKRNAASFRTLIYYLCKYGEFEKGYKVFKESVKMHKIPDFNTMNILVEGLVEKKKMREAKGLIRTIKKKFPPDLLKSWEKLEKKLGLDSIADDAEKDDETKT